MSQLRSMGGSDHENDESEQARSFFKKGDKTTEHFFHRVLIPIVNFHSGHSVHQSSGGYGGPSAGYCK